MKDNDTKLLEEMYSQIPKTEKWGGDAEDSVRDSVFNIDPGMSFKIHAALKRHPELGEALMNTFPMESAFHAYLQENL